MKTIQVLAALLLLCANIFAQAGSAGISGVVRDPSGSAVPGAHIKATQTDTGAVRMVDSGADGTYLFTNLPIGPYKLEISKEGFSTSVQSGIVLQVASNPNIEITLQLGAVSQQVQVEASALTVETRSSGIGQVVDQQRVIDLPLNGRNPTDLIYLAGAAAQAPNADLVSTKNYPNEAPISVAGGLATGTTYVLDGGNHNDPFNNLSLPLPFPDALQEFKVETSALPAMYGQHSGAAVNAVTKSGTNNWHGDAFEFVRNYIFNARQFNAPSRDSLKRNQYGGTIGGPIKKDKLFFFAGFQGTAIRTDPTGSFSFVPTQAMLNGDFSAVASAACNGGVAKTLKAPFTAGNQVNPQLFNASSLKMLSFFTLSTDPCGKQFFGVKQNFDEKFGVMKVDYNINDKHSLFARYLVTHALVGTPFDGKNPLTETISGADDLVNSMVIGETYIINPNTINSFHVTGDRSGVTKTQIPSFDASTLGINMTTLVPGHLVATATGALYSSSVFSYAATDPVTSFQAADDINMIRGNHQMQFGVNWLHSLQWVYGPLFGDGSFTFSGATTGMSMADFLLGYVSSFTQGGIQYANERYTYFGGYAQDTWKVTPRLTLNYGIRWEPYFGNTMSNGHVGHFYSDLFAQGVHSSVYPNAPAGYLFAGDSQFDTNNRPAYIKLNDWAPRFGLAWDPTGSGKTSVRASWGMFYDLPQTVFSYGFSQEPPWATTVSRAGTAAAPLSFSNPWAGVAGGNPFPLSTGKNAVFPANNATYTTYPLNLQITYLEQWNVAVQRQVAKWLLSASYLGNNTIHLWGDNPINAPRITGAAFSQARRPLTLLNATQGAYYGTIHSLDTGGTAGYNAMLLSAQHAFANNFSVLANYTWSHCISDPFTSELDGQQWTNPASRRFDRGNCNGIDRRHNINISAVAQTPKYGNRVVQAVASGWKFSPIVRIMSGAYYSVTSGVDNTGTGLTAPGDRPNQVLANPYCAVQTPSCWLNPAAFVNPSLTAGQLGLGNVGAGSIHGPGSFTFDASLSRDFKVKESQQIEVRWEVFNIPNHWRPGFAPAGVSTTTVGTTRTSGTFGQIQVFGDPRIMQFAIKYMF